MRTQVRSAIFNLKHQIDIKFEVDTNHSVVLVIPAVKVEQQTKIAFTYELKQRGPSCLYQRQSNLSLTEMEIGHRIGIVNNFLCVQC